jgi:hypothetical protein
MAGTATLSSCFTVEYLPSNATQTFILNPGRPFRVIAVSGNNDSGGSQNLDVGKRVAGVVTGQAFVAAQSIVTVTNTFPQLAAGGAVRDIGSNDDLSVNVATTAIDTVEIWCIGAAGGTTLVAT